ncbi:addiction module protein [Geminisphaera colitermitum]|uniref:addiction module protein n=1 Tax=Geminisphaera colitermitum TaxID=1148786 RepID=UPI000158D088|nr:addiction module protein [Geminisphaera colitermitum]
MSLAELHQLPNTEKLRIIEALWGDLASEADTIESPDWHEEELRKTEARLLAGEEEVLDWQDAKEKLRRRFS